MDEDLPQPWFAPLLRRVRPREGWLIFGLAWAAVLCLPAAALDARWLDGLEPGLWLATLALILGWRLGHARRLAGPLATVILAVAGVASDLIWGVYALNLGLLFGSVGQALQYLGWWAGPHRAPAPAMTYLAQQGRELSEFYGRLTGWIEGLTGKQPAIPDNLVVAGLALLLVWAAAAWAGWWTARHGRPFEGLLPSLALMAVLIFVTGRGPVWLLVLLVILPPLLALQRTRFLEQRWEAEGADYSPEMNLTAAFSGLAVAVLVLVVTPTLPYLTSRQFADSFWRLFEKPYRQVEQRVNESFPAVAGAHSLVPPGGVEAGGLPRAHLLGGRPELGQRVSLRVTLRGSRPGDVLYWRGQTFSVYDGHGWATDAGAVQMRNLNAGQPWLAEQPLNRHTVLAYVDVYAASLGVLYGPAEPVSADRSYSARQRAAGELIDLSASSPADTYTILASVPEMNANALRAAGADYPQEIRDLYLGLPEGIPAEVKDYAAQITAGAATPYDAAAAIERALRQYPYSLDVPVPPRDRELVSWFLFDLKRGYCDYYASAMVVLAREAGIPARLAVGYATGRLDQKGYYEVTELQAHSWPELYFPRLGWIPFEPTAAEPEPARSDGAVPPDLLDAAPPPLPESDLSALAASGRQYAADRARTALFSAILAALNALGLAVVLLRSWQLTHPGAFTPLPAGPAGAYARLLAWGSRLGRPPLPTDTPREYGAALADAAAASVARARRKPPALERAAATATSSALRLAEEFEMAEYAGHDTAENGKKRQEESYRARWAPLWGALRRLWIARRFGL